MGHASDGSPAWLTILLTKPECPSNCRNSSSSYSRSQAMAAAPFMSSAPWRCVSRPFVRLRELGRHRQWLPQVFDLGPQPSCRMMSKVGWLSARKKPWPKPAAEGAEVSKASSATHVVFPRPSSVPFREDLVNTVHLIGKLEDDVEVRVVAGRQLVVNVCLAVNKSADVRVPQSLFDLLFWGRFAIFAGQHLKKGDIVYVTGEVTVQSFFMRSPVRPFVFLLRSCTCDFQRIFKHDFSEVFVLNFNRVRKSQSSGAAMAHRPSAGTPSPLSQHPDTNKIVETKRHNRKDDRKFGQRLIKLHPKKEQAIDFGHSLQKLETLLKNGTDVTSLESGNDGWEAFKSYCISRWRVGLGAAFNR